MAAGVMIGGVLQLAVQMPVLRRLGLLPRIGLRRSTLRDAWNDPGTRHVVRMMLPALLGVSVAQVSLLINTQIASWLRDGQRQLADLCRPVDGVPDGACWASRSAWC